MAKTTTTTIMDGCNEPSIKEVLKNGPFMLLFTAQFAQNVGAAVSWLAMEFLIFGLTGSPALMGLLSIVFWLPYVLFTPFAGVYIDRFDQRKIMLLANLISMIATLGFMFVYLGKDLLIAQWIVYEALPNGQQGITYYSNPTNVIWPMFILTFINSTAASTFFPARNAYTRLIVQKKNLLIANSVGSTVYQIATIVGYVLAGILAAISYLTSFIFDASTFLLSLSLIVVIIFYGQKPPEVKRKKSESVREELQSVFEDLKVGYRTIRQLPKISYMLVIFASAIFSFAAFNVLFIVVLQGEMNLSSTWYGLLQALMGGSGIITSLILMNVGRIKRKILMLNYVMIGLVVVLFGFSVFRNVWIMALILLLLGILLVCVNIPASTLIQEFVPYEKQGRVFGTQQLVQGFARLLGMGVVSLIAEIVLPMYILLASSALLAIVAIAGFIYSSRNGLTSSDYEMETVECETGIEIAAGK